MLFVIVVVTEEEATHIIGGVGTSGDATAARGRGRTFARSCSGGRGGRGGLRTPQHLVDRVLSARRGGGVDYFYHLGKRRQCCLGQRTRYVSQCKMT